MKVLDSIKSAKEFGVPLFPRFATFQYKTAGTNIWETFNEPTTMQMHEAFEKFMKVISIISF